MDFNLPQNINFVLDTLIKNGHSAYIVGGCVRDLLRGKTPNDFDITTSALPEETQKLFKKTIATGLKHGTVTAIIDGTPIEITTFRTEGVYNDGRHPQNVNFVRDVTQDLARRDFTVNAICYNKHDGLIDIFGGAEDINNKILRAVGIAETRFKEDALRILRLFRFAATLQFDIEQATLDAAIKCAPLLKNISAERIFSELSKTSMGSNISAITPLLKTNALAEYYIKNNDLSKTINLPFNERLRTFAFFYLTSNDLSKTLDLLKCSNSFKNYCEKMSHLVTNVIKPDKTSIKIALNYADFDIVNDALIYYRDVLNIDISSHNKNANEIFNLKEPYKISHLDITGSDIINLGFKGEQVGEKLDFLLQEVIKNPDLNNKTKLLKLIM